MAYEKYTWVTGEVITQEKLNHMEDGIAAAFTDDMKAAILECFEHVAWTNQNGQQYYNRLYAALTGELTVISISAVYTQSGVVYNTDSLDDLKDDLVVTATWSDDTTTVLDPADYTLSGSLEAPSSVITAIYENASDTFNVTVTVNREALFGVFENGYAVSKAATSSTYPNLVPFAYRASTAARATTQIPCANSNYVFTVTDSTKYNINVVDVTSLTELSIPNVSDSVDGIGYSCGAKTVGWNTTDSVTTSYCWIALKKLDGTSFTDAELANGAAAVFTFTEQ